MLNNMTRLDFLNTIEDSARRKRNGLPSWVPDFSTSTGPTRFGALQQTYMQRAEFDASKRPSPTSLFRLTSQKTLVLQGVMLSVVSDRGADLTYLNHGNLDAEWFLKTLLSYTGYYAQTDETADESLCRTLVANLVSNSTDQRVLAATFRQWWSRRLVKWMNWHENKVSGSIKKHYRYPGTSWLELRVVSFSG